MHQNALFLMTLVQDLISFLVACLKNFNENNNNWKEKMHF